MIEPMTHDRTHEEMEKMRSSFISSAAKNGVDKTIAEKVFEQLSAFAAYGFCKAHAATYAILAYQTLWLKCHYPAEFFAAVLSNQPMGYYPPHVLIAEARRSGVEIRPPDINRSSDRYTCDGGSIRISLAQLKGMSSGALGSIMTQRAEGEFTSLRDFVLRTRVSQAIVENLIRVGAFDSLGTRGEMLSELPGLVALSHKVGKGAKPLIEDTRTETGEIQDDLYIDKRMRMLAERELLSLDLSAHPLDFYHLDSGFTRIKNLPLATTGRAVKIAGSVIRYQTPPTRNGNRVLYVIMEDGTGIADVTVFGNVQEKCGPVLFREGWLIVEGKVQRRGPKALSIIADNLSPLTLG